jgi:rhodanese-related sulfurtransferase
MRLFGKKKREFDPVEADDLVLDQLRKLGTDLTKPRDARFYLYVRTEGDARAAADELRAEGYATVVEPSATPRGEHPWLALASRDMVVDADTIAEARRLFGDLAERYSGEYDGWEAAAG